MKKKYCLIFALVLSLLLSACGGGAGYAPDSAPPSPLATPPPAEQPQASGAPYASEYATIDEYMPFEYDGGYGLDNGSEGESYLEIDDNPPKSTAQEPMLTFSLKVDTASYTNVARYIGSGNLPPADAVRTEELINYFSYDQDMSFSGGDPFALYTEIGPSPFDTGKYMAFIRVKSKDIDKSELPKSNLTFLIDTSGSMDSYDKLPLLEEAFGLLVEVLGEDDKVSVVTYAGSSSVALDSVSGADKKAILSAVNSLRAGGSTAGGEGIMTAYALAEKNFIKGGNNRVILATDGDFNVGVSDIKELEKLIGQKRDSGIYLSVLGFGTGNIRDDIMETLSKNGNGNYSYINSISTARKVLVDEMASNLFTIADDVKAQVEFNPENVSSYRLIGYENRRLRNEDFADDTKDAGEIGVGTDVVLMFELELQNGGGPSLKYQSSTPEREDFGNELFEVRIRYKNPGQSESNLILQPVTFQSIPQMNSTDFQFACSVASFGHLLRDSRYAGKLTVEDVIELAINGVGGDMQGYRREYIDMLVGYREIIMR